MTPREICSHACNRYPRTSGYLIVVTTLALVLQILEAVGVL